MRDDAVLVGQPDNLQGILTLSDLLVYLKGIADPFILISECELVLRRIIQFCLTIEQLRDYAKDILKGVYGADKLPTSLQEMTFDGYVALIRDGRSWNHFEPVFGSGEVRRTFTQTRLSEIRDIRNDVFHFKREITREDIALLTEHRDWLLEIATEVENGENREGNSQ